MELEGEEERLWEFRRGELLVELWEPSRWCAFETEFSRLRVSYVGEKSPRSAMDRADTFGIVLFKPGRWEGALTGDI